MGREERSRSRTEGRSSITTPATAHTTFRKDGMGAGASDMTERRGKGDLDMSKKRRTQGQWYNIIIIGIHMNVGR
jgi:hypothetical protein